MFNLLPHLYQRIGKWLILIMTVGQFLVAICLGFFDMLIYGEEAIQWGDETPKSSELTKVVDSFIQNWVTENVVGALIAVGILLYILSKDKIQDEYIDMLKLKSVSIVFIVSAVIGFLLHNTSTSLSTISLFQVGGYIVILNCFKKLSV